MFKAQNRPVIIAFILPIAIIIFAAISIYIPKWYAKPQYNFIYSIYDSYNATKLYEYNNGKVVERYVPLDTPSQYPYKEPKLYLHDTQLNESKEISYEESQRYNLIDSMHSPDGYIIEHGSYTSGSFLFEDEDTSKNVYLVNDFISKKMNIVKNVDPGYYSDMHFIGWVKR